MGNLISTIGHDSRQMMINRAVFIKDLSAMLRGARGSTMENDIASVLNLKNWVDEFNQLRVFPDQREV